MPVVRKFIRHCSPAELKAYFSWASLPLTGVNWSQNKTTLIEHILRQVDNFTDKDKNRIRLDAERIVPMADEIGQAALLSAVIGSRKFSNSPSPVARSLWVYLHEPDSFQRAEDIRYADQQRHGPYWNHYGVPPGTPVILNASALEAFEQAMKALFGSGDKVKVEIFDRILRGYDGGELKAIQGLIYQECLPITFLEFRGGALVPRVLRPVSEHVVLYVQVRGVIEVLAANRVQRDVIAKAFTEHLLKLPVRVEAMPLCQFDLTPLIENHPLVWDAEDGIESVRVLMIKLIDRVNGGHVIVEVPALEAMTFHEFVQDRFKDNNPFRSRRFVPAQAKIAIQFKPDGSRRPKMLPITISLPSGCNLRNYTERERVVGEKYLKRWGLLRELYL